MSAAHNPFPGPQPYRTSDRGRFYGRADLSARLQRSLLAHRCTTVYGPSGAGKSSLVQASAIPSLIESHDIDVVRIDAWPADKDPSQWLADTMHSELDLGPRQTDIAPEQAIRMAVRRVARRSSKLVLIYLDQVEQLLEPSRNIDEIEAFFDCLESVVHLPLRNVRVLLALREDYLGRFRDRLRQHRRLLDHGFRVSPLSVAEISEAVCQAAAAGTPPQTWDLDSTRALMLQVRVPGQVATNEAESQAAYAQIVCRALFQQRFEHGQSSRTLEAETVLREYLEMTLGGLGPLRNAAQRLLEEHLVSGDGTRTLRTEKELLRVLPEQELAPILKALEGAAILHAEEHQGSRYFEIGHDWLGRRVFEHRQQHEIEEQQKEKMAKEHAQRRRLAVIAILSLTIAAIMGGLALWALDQKRYAEEARQMAVTREEDAKRAQKEAEEQKKRAEEQKKRAEELKKQAEDEKRNAEANERKANEALDQMRQARQVARYAQTNAEALSNRAAGRFNGQLP